MQDYLYSLTGDDDMELHVVKDETTATRYLPADPDCEEHRKAATLLTKHIGTFEEMYDKNEKIATKVMKKQYCLNSAKKKKPKEFREWRRDYIRETDGDQMAALTRSLQKMRGDPRSKKVPAPANSNQKTAAVVPNYSTA